MNSFEFDAAKSKSNRTKHGIDFVEAQVLWNDPMLLEIPAKTDDEPRYLVIGSMDGKHWSAVLAYRGANVRLISVRRARTEEVALFDIPPALKGGNSHCWRAMSGTGTQLVQDVFSVVV